MSKLLSKFKRNAIDSFIADTEIANNSYYVFVGGQREYPTSDVPVEIESVQSEHNTWDEMMFGKKPSFSPMVEKNVWKSGTVYTQYDDTEEQKGENFFVVTSTRDVFKCIYNGGGAPSTIEPTKRASKLGVPVLESDGYEWLYLYTIDAVTYTRFVTRNYMPVSANTLIESAAIDGALFAIAVETEGNSYPYHANTIAGVVNTSVFQLESTANSTANYYKDSSVAVTDITTKETFVRRILASNTSLWITTEPFPNNFLNTSCSYKIGPTVTISSNTGSGAVAYSVVDLGAVKKIEMVEYGSGYREATATLTSGTGLGEGAFIRPIISPIGGHGSKVFDELYVDSLGVHCLFDEWGSSNSEFNADVTYRTVGLLKNPTYSNGEIYTSNTFNQIVTINTNIGTGSFTLGETVRGLTSNQTGNFAYSNNSVVLVTGATGAFLENEEIVGATSQARRTVNTANSNTVDLKMYSGDVLYVQNIQEVTRSNTNNEQIKLVISF